MNARLFKHLETVQCSSSHRQNKRKSQINLSVLQEKALEKFKHLFIIKTRNRRDFS